MKISNSIFIQGALLAKVLDNTFRNNGIPSANLFDTTKNPAFADNVFWLVGDPDVNTANSFVESSPVVIRMGDYALIEGNTFDSNRAGTLKKNEYYISLGITLDLMYGRDDIIIRSNIFENH